MSNYIFDTHSHYDDKAFDSDRDEILNGLFEKGIGKVVDVGADMVSSKMALELAGQYEFVYAALGVHPSEVEGLTESDMAWIVNHASHEKVVAIGEIGLDYHWPEPEPAECREHSAHDRFPHEPGRRSPDPEQSCSSAGRLP